MGPRCPGLSKFSSFFGCFSSIELERAGWKCSHHKIRSEWLQALYFGGPTYVSLSRRSRKRLQRFTWALRPSGHGVRKASLSGPTPSCWLSWFVLSFQRYLCMYICIYPCLCLSLCLHLFLFLSLSLSLALAPSRRCICLSFVSVYLSAYVICHQGGCRNAGIQSTGYDVFRPTALAEVRTLLLGMFTEIAVSQP